MLRQPVPADPSDCYPDVVRWLALLVLLGGCDPGPVRPGLDGSPPGDAGCPAMCGTRCVDTSSDPGNCGGCDVRCMPGSFCSEGRCQVTCQPPLTACGEQCVDTSASPNHCGACDSPCPGTLGCVSGICGCSAPLTECGEDCVDLDTTLEHCGGCDDACGPHGFTCDAASCELNEFTRFDFVLENGEIPPPVGGGEWDPGGQPDVYANVRVGSMMMDAPIQMSATIRNEPNPQWGEAVVTNTTARSFLTYMRIDVYDEDAGDDQLIGACTIPLGEGSLNGSLRRFTCPDNGTTPGWVLRGRFVAP